MWLYVTMNWLEDDVHKVHRWKNHCVQITPVIPFEWAGGEEEWDAMDGDEWNDLMDAMEDDEWDAMADEIVDEANDRLANFDCLAGEDRGECSSDLCGVCF